MNNIIKRVWNQNRMVNIEDLSGMAFQAESGGHTFEISGIDDTGAAVPLSGTVAGVFRRADNADIALTGSASGGIISVTLTADCYAVPGRFGLTIFVTSNSQKVAIYAAVGTIAQTSGGAVAGDTPQDVVDLINAIEAAIAEIPASYTDIMAAIAPTYSSSALYPVGSYAWHSGKLYRSIVPITTAETWTAAHWTLANLGETVSDIFDDVQAFERVQSAVDNMATSKNLFNEATGFEKAYAWDYADGFYFGPLKGSGGIYGNLGPDTDGIPLSFPFDGFKEATAYTVAMTAKHEGTDTTGIGLMVKARYTDDTTETLISIYNDQRSLIRKIGVTNAEKTVKKLYLTYGSNGNNTAYIKDMIITEGATDGVFYPYKVVAQDETARSMAKKAKVYDGFIFRLNDLPASIPVGASHISYSDLIGMWDELADDINALAEKEYHQSNNFADSVTKAKVGVSTTTDTVTTSYDIFSYTFEPRNAEYTVLLTAGCDGNEYEAYWSLYRFMHALYFEGYKYPNLRNLRHKVRFVCIPAWNPWGVENNLRNCPLGFQCLDNLNKPVTVDDTTYPAFTSKECQAIRSCINKMFIDYSKIDLWVDMHTDPYSATHDWKKAFYGYAPYPSAINDVLYGLTLDFDNIIFDETGTDTNFTIYNSPDSSNSGMPGYGTGRGIPTALIEMAIGEFKTAPDSQTMMQSGSAQTMKYAQEWYWNVIVNMVCAL